MKVGIIGYGSMGKMLLWKFSESGIGDGDLFVSNRTAAKLDEANEIATVLDNKAVAGISDIVFVCVRPADLKSVLEEIRDFINPEALLVSLPFQSPIWRYLRNVRISHGKGKCTNPESR